MKKRKVGNKAEKVKQKGEAKTEVTPEQPQPKHQIRSPWDDLVFIRPSSQLKPTVQAEETTEETIEIKPSAKPKRQGRSWI